MSRYNVPTGSEGEYEPGSGHKVLKNLMGIKSLSLMHNIEDLGLHSVENKYFESEIITADTRITAAIICRMHKHWLGEIYEWAGRYRTVDISKGGFAFPGAWLVQRNMENFESDILFVCCGNATFHQLVDSEVIKFPQPKLSGKRSR